MRDIEGIDEVVRKIKPFLPEIEDNFERENDRFKALISQDHGLIGRVLKCHLILEHYLERFLAQHFGTESMKEAKLSFFQKAQLLPNQGHAAAFVRPGILRLNAIRNKFGHTLSPELEMGELEPLSQVLRLTRAGTNFAEPIDVIEAFTTVACTWLIIVPEHLQQAWIDAFSHVRVEP